ncbi:MAG TPA: M28 family peptidase [Bacteroidota bacterium]|nr:M28 family peptidase [Bacteroidota bacterium]
MKSARFKLSLVLFFATCFFTTALAQQNLSITEELYGYVLGIEGSDVQQRREFIISQLQQMGVGYAVAPFTEIVITKPDSLGKRDTLTYSGQNIIAHIGTDFKKIIVSAHYDVAKNSPGANDNGSGVAVALALLNYFKDQDMKHSLEVCFFDQKENGLFGSINYIKQFAIAAKHIALLNLDVVGSGNEVYIGPVGGGDDVLLMPILREAMRALPYHYVERANYPLSDYVPFASVGLENISISVVPEGDGDKLASYAKDGGLKDSINAPRVFTFIHTPLDRSNYVSPHSLKMAFEFTKETIILLNRRR